MGVGFPRRSYPTHPLGHEPERRVLKRMTRIRRRPRWIEKLRAAVLALAARILNYRRFEGTWRVSLDGLEEGDVRVVLSVLYEPFAEIDLEQPQGAPPQRGYYDD